MVQVASNILLNLNLVGMGLGFALLPAYVSALTGESIRCRPLDCEPPSIDLLMACRADNHSPALGKLLELMRGVVISG